MSPEFCDENLDPQMVEQILKSLEFRATPRKLDSPIQKKINKRGAYRKPYVRKTVKAESRRSTAKRESRPRSPKIGGKKQNSPGSLWWFVQHGAIKPAPKCEPNAMDISGYHYLKGLDLSASPYTVLVGRYKGDERYFVVGRESSEHYVLVYIPDIDVLPSPTSAPSRFIREYQERDPDGVKNDARMSGFEYLRFRHFQMSWMHEPEEFLTLGAARLKIEAEIIPSTQAVRNPEDLYQSLYPSDISEENLLDPNMWYMPDPDPGTPVKPEYPYDTYPSLELANQCSSYLEFPDSFKSHIGREEYSHHVQIKDENINGEIVQMPELEESPQPQNFELTEEQIQALLGMQDVFDFPLE